MNESIKNEIKIERELKIKDKKEPEEDKPIVKGNSKYEDCNECRKRSPPLTKFNVKRLSKVDIIQCRSLGSAKILMKRKGLQIQDVLPAYGVEPKRIKV